MFQMFKQTQNRRITSQASAVAGGVVGGAGTKEKTADLGKKKRSATFFFA
jgi:hypothetical protein